MLFPIGDDNRGRQSTPFITWGLISINVMVWFAQLNSGDAFTLGYAVTPYEIVYATDLTESIQFQNGDEISSISHVPGPNPIFLTLLFSMFMHGSWGHLIGNMLYLFIFGDQIEDILGHGKYLAFYLLTGLLATLSHILIDPESVVPLLGASGAIAGVLGAYLIKYPLNRIRMWFFFFTFYLPAYLVLGFWIFQQLYAQVSLVGDGVAYIAHIGGFFAGSVLIIMWRTKDENPAWVHKYTHYRHRPL